MPVKRKTLRIMLMVLFSALGLWLVALPQPAAAQNVHCEPRTPTSNPSFGSSPTQTFTQTFECINADDVVRSHTLCLRRGDGQHPGTQDQPAMGMGNNVLQFNLYRDASGFDEWLRTNYITQPLTLSAGQRLDVTFTFYGRIRPGQNLPPGLYTNGGITNTELGIVNAGQCQRAPSGIEFQGATVNMYFQANLVASCTLGTIGAIHFGTRSDLGLSVDYVDAAGQVQLSCPANTPWRLRFDGGRHRLDDERRMQSTASDFLPYTLYSDQARNDQIEIDGVIVGRSPTSPATSTVNVPVYGRVEPATPPPAGVYTDSVTVTLSL